MSPVRSSLAVVLSLALLAACAADAPRSGVSGGEVVSTPAPVDSGAASAVDSAAAVDIPAATANTPSAPAATPPVAATATDAVTGPVAGDSVVPRLAPGRPTKDATSFAAAIRAGTRKEASWPAGPAPIAGALLPKNRIIAFYGNPLSKKMGVLGEYPEQQMLAMLDRTVVAWKGKADPTTPVHPALHLIVSRRAGRAGDGRRCGAGARTRQMIEQHLRLGESQEGAALPRHPGGRTARCSRSCRGCSSSSSAPTCISASTPSSTCITTRRCAAGAKIGTLTRGHQLRDPQLDKLVAEKNLPPKILVVHRFTRDGAERGEHPARRRACRS